MQIRELNLKELYIAYDLVSQSYMDMSYQEFEDLIYDMRFMEYKMLGVFEGEGIKAYAGVCVQTTLKEGRHLRVFDLVIDKYDDIKKYKKIMLKYLDDYAKIAMCDRIIYRNTF